MLEVSIFWAHLLLWFKIRTLFHHHKFPKSAALCNYYIIIISNGVYCNNYIINATLIF